MTNWYAASKDEEANPLGLSEKRRGRDLNPRRTKPPERFSRRAELAPLHAVSWSQARRSTLLPFDDEHAFPRVGHPVDESRPDEDLIAGRPARNAGREVGGSAGSPSVSSRRNSKGIGFPFLSAGGRSREPTRTDSVPKRC
jgi:hypothetical protein